MIRTRSNDQQQQQRRQSGMHRHAVGGVRRPPKRRRLGRSSLAAAATIRQLEYSSSTSTGSGSDKGDDAASDHNNPAGNAGSNGYNSPRPRTRKLGRLKTIKLPRTSVFPAAGSSSPRKRKRDDAASSHPNSAGSGSWIETADEMDSDLICKEDEHLLQTAPAHALHRLRKNELIRLWKVAGMWPDHDMVEEEDYHLGKAQLVTGIMAARTESSVSAKSSLGTSLSYRDTTRSDSTLTSPPDTSDSHSRDVDVTPKAARARTRGAQTQRGGLDPAALLRGTPLRKDRLKKGGRATKPKRPLKARFGPNVKSPEQQRRITTRSSTLSSQFSTTDGSTDDDNVEATPIVRRLRPRKDASYTSKASNHDADAEDNGDDSLVSPSARRQSGSFVRRGLQREAKRTAPRVVDSDSDSNGDLSWEDASSPEYPHAAKPPKGSAPAKGGSKPSRGSKSPEGKEAKDTKGLKEAKEPKGGSKEGKEHTGKSSKGSKGSGGLRETAGSPKGSSQPRRGSTRRHSDAMSIDGGEDHDINSARTTRSGKVFGDIRDSPQLDDDESMDEDEPEEPSSSDLGAATLSSLTRMRRDELVQMCEVRSLPVGGTKIQLAQALLDWCSEDSTERTSTTSSQSTARPGTPDMVVKAVASNSRKDGQETPVLLRTHIHGHGPATPPRSNDHDHADADADGDGADSGATQDNDLNLDLQELGLEDFTIKPEHLVKLDKIGSGGFKDVYVGKLRGRKVAISEFRGHLSEMDMRELKLLAEFRHPNIVRFRGICIPEDSSQIPCMLISELCENGDLYDYIRNTPTPPLKRVLRLMLDIARGLEYLHLRTPSIIHRDCKSTNILITRGNVAKVGDFGLARVKHTTRSMIASLVGTVNWQAPELWHANPRYDYKVDVFSAALVYWEMLSGWVPQGEKKYPWEGHNEHYIYDAVGQKHKRPSLAGLRKQWGTAPIALIERMWAQDPRERPTMSDVVADLQTMIAECK